MTNLQGRDGHGSAKVRVRKVLQSDGLRAWVLAVLAARKSGICGEGGGKIDLCGMGFGENPDLPLHEFDFLLLGGN